MSSKNFLIQSLQYTGRRFQQHRPSAYLASKNPDLQWCIVCNQTVLKSEYGRHCASKSHQLNVRKDVKLKDFALGLWEDHRGAPIAEESSIERRIDSGEIAETIARQNDRSSDFATRMLVAERNRARLLKVEEGEDAAEHHGGANVGRGQGGRRHQREYGTTDDSPSHIAVPAGDYYDNAAPAGSSSNAASSSAPLVNHAARSRFAMVDALVDGDMEEVARLDARRGVSPSSASSPSSSGAHRGATGRSIGDGIDYDEEDDMRLYSGTGQRSAGAGASSFVGNRSGNRNHHRDSSSRRNGQYASSHGDRPRGGVGSASSSGSRSRSSREWARHSDNSRSVSGRGPRRI